MIGQSTKAMQLQQRWKLTYAEHIAFQYRRQIEEQLGVPLPLLMKYYQN